MKKFLILFVISFSLYSCKSEQKDKSVDLKENRNKSYSQDDGFITVKGEFVYYADAAVLQTKSEIYGVVIDENMHILEKQVKAFKQEDTDMVPVTVRVKKLKKPEDEEGWPYRVEIKEILKVEAPNTNKEDVIKVAK